MIWLDNLKLVLEHNLLADQGIKSYRLGMNHFADMVISHTHLSLLKSLSFSSV